MKNVEYNEVVICELIVLYIVYIFFVCISFYSNLIDFDV